MKDQFVGDKGPLIFYEIGGGLVEIGGRGMRKRMAFEGGPSQKIMENGDLDKTQDIQISCLGPLRFRFCPRVPVHKNRYKRPNNVQQLNKNS